MKIIEKLKAKQESIYGAEPVTIAFLGDSVTQGCFECYLTSPTSLQTVFDYPNAYSTRVREMFNLLYPNAQVNIVNSGISGDNATNGFSRLERDILRFNPDLVVVGFALNDSCSGADGLERYKNSIRSILETLQAKGIECILLTPNMMNTNTSCHLRDELFIRLAKQFAEVQNSGMLTAYVDAEKAIANELGVPVCDVYAKWLQMQEGGVEITELLANKLNHPVRELHYYTAMKLLEVMFS
ncbi:MAG: GDSL family lipase [Clostridia bacterium]|nr:GDSL family lipase [Clostridia bacterium]